MTIISGTFTNFRITANVQNESVWSFLKDDGLHKICEGKEDGNYVTCTDLSMTTRKQGDYFDLKEVMLIIVVKLPAL